MNNLGLVSVLSPTTIATMILITVSFAITLQRKTIRLPLLLLHAALMFIMLYGITPLVEQMPRFDIVYRIAGYTQYIQSTKTTNPNLDAYFSWPTMFSLAAFYNLCSNYKSILAYADWSPVAFAILYFGPLYLIFSSFTKDKRIIWLAMWFFYLTNWIWQDYFSPQGFNFFLYLTMVAIIVKWFKTPVEVVPRPLMARLRRIRYAPQFYDWLTAPDPQQTPASPALRVALLVSFVIIYMFDVSSHQLTPFFTMMCIGGLIVCHRTRIWWLLIFMIAFEAFWLLVMAQTFIAGHMNMVFDGINIQGSLNQNVGSRVSGDPQHMLVAKLRVYMSVLVWLLGFLGAVVRLLHKKKDASMVILAVLPFPLFIVQPYGGEMMLRSYMFSLPAMGFFAASFFYCEPIAALQKLSSFRFFSFLKHLPLSRLQRPAWHHVAVVLLNVVLISGFFFTRYGNENDDYMTYDEFNGVNWLYNHAPAGSLFMTCFLGGPWQYEGYAKYKFDGLEMDPVNVIDPANIPGIIQYMQQDGGTNQYLIFTRSEIATYNATSGLTPGYMTTLEKDITNSGDFNLIYRNPDVQIYQLVNTTNTAQGGQ
jgi:hypothetical protein